MLAIIPNGRVLQGRSVDVNGVAMTPRAAEFAARYNLDPRLFVGRITDGLDEPTDIVDQIRALLQGDAALEWAKAVAAAGRAALRDLEAESWEWCPERPACRGCGKADARPWCGCMDSVGT
jgi:hypothetical protein